MASKQSRIPRVPTHTSKIMDALAHAPEDFMSVQQLMAATGSAHNQCTAALFHLRRRGAVDVVVEEDGRGWWFATPADDTRTRVVEERRPEDKPRRSRQSRVSRKLVAQNSGASALGDNPRTAGRRERNDV